MRKRIICTLLVAWVLNSIPTQAAGMGYASEIGVNYYSWGNVFGVSDISTDFRYADKDEFGDGTLYIDDLVVVYDWHTLKAETVYLFFIGSKDDVSHQIMKMNALVAALEYDEHPQPEDWYFATAGEMLVKTMPVYQKLCDVINDSNDDVLMGKYVPFHESQEWTYYISYDISLGYVVIVQ